MKNKILVIALFTITLTSCASTYYQQLPGKQPAEYTESETPKEKLVDKLFRRKTDKLDTENVSLPNLPNLQQSNGIDYEQAIDALTREIAYYTTNQFAQEQNIDLQNLQEINEIQRTPEEIITENINQNRQTVTGNANFNNAITQYTYINGVIYDVYFNPNNITDIRLEQDEIISQVIFGDVNNWICETISAQENDDNYTHLLIRPCNYNIQTDCMVVTNRRVYYFRLISTSKTGQLVVQFRYPLSAKNKISGDVISGGIYNTATELGKGIADCNFNYKISGSASWKPIRAYSDTSRTYIQFANSFSTNSTTPVVYLRKNGTDSQVNFTCKGITYIVPIILSSNEVFVLKAENEECLVGY